MSSPFYIFNNDTLRALGYTQMQICMASGISPSTLAGILYRGTIPSLTTARKIATTLGIPLDSLHFISEQPSARTMTKPQPAIYESRATS